MGLYPVLWLQNAKIPWLTGDLAIVEYSRSFDV